MNKQKFLNKSKGMPCVSISICEPFNAGSAKNKDAILFLFVVDKSCKQARIYKKVVLTYLPFCFELFAIKLYFSIILRFNLIYVETLYASQQCNNFVSVQ